MSMTVYHLNILANKIVVDDLNSKGWGGHELYEMHCDITLKNDLDQAKKAWLDGHYKAVAIVQDELSQELENAFHQTNHINTPWTDNKHVWVLGGPAQRSTSTGDLVEKDGELFLVASIGFEKLEGVQA